jgi:hypothetical protein
VRIVGKAIGEQLLAALGNFLSLHLR